MRVIAIDWSGRQAGSRNTIWLAEVDEGKVARVECGRSRMEIADHLIEIAAADPELIVGLDFAFSLPAWYLRDRGLPTARHLWESMCVEGEAMLAACEPPFWGRPGCRKPQMESHFRLTDMSVPGTGGIRPKSVFQIGGAGAVGTGSLRGMPVLARLAAHGFFIWPFESSGMPLVVEIYPRALTGPVVKSRPDDRRRRLDAKAPHVPDDIRSLAAASEDAFDALLSVLVMHEHLDDLRRLPATQASIIKLEGSIWYPGWEDDLLDATPT